jgi:hypothetical protein
MLISDSDIHIISSEFAGINFKVAYDLQDIPLLQRDPNPNAQKPVRVIFHLTDRLLVQRDVLSWGPAPKCASVQDWKQIRMDYIRGLFPAYPDIDLNNLKTDLLYNENRLNEVDFIYIWAGIGLEDQLLILFVVYLFELVGGDPKKIKLVRYETFPDGSMPMYAMDFLDPIQMRVHPEPISLTQEQIEYYQAGWAALTSDTPLPLMQFISSSQPWNKHLTSALHYLLRRYPRAESGLDYWDTQILTHVGKRNRLMVKIIRKVWGRDFDGDMLAEFHLLNKIAQLASSELPEPLLKISGAQTSYRDTKVALTKFGLAVQNGEASFYPTNPIDKWVGGVHLSSATGNLWFYKDGQVVKSE